MIYSLRATLGCSGAPGACSCCARHSPVDARVGVVSVVKPVPLPGPASGSALRWPGFPGGRPGPSPPNSSVDIHPGPGHRQRQHGEPGGGCCCLFKGLESRGRYNKWTCGGTSHAGHHTVVWGLRRRDRAFCLLTQASEAGRQVGGGRPASVRAGGAGPSAGREGCPGRRCLAWSSTLT